MTPNTSAIESPLPLLKRSDRIARERGVKWQQWPETLYQQDNSDAETLNCSHPDLEDGSLIAWGLQQSSHSTGEGVEIDVLYGNGTDLFWPCNINDGELSRIMELPPPSLRICFINTLKSDSSWLPGNFSPRQRTVRTLRKAGLSGVLLCNMYSEQSYWAKMGNQRYMKYDDEGRLSAYEICYQYRCGWDTGVSFIHSKREQQRTTYFCINYPSGARERLQAIFRHKARRNVFHRDFFFDTIVADDSLKQWQCDIGERRLKLHDVEKKFEKPAPSKKLAEGITCAKPQELQDSKHVTLPKLKGVYRYDKRDIEHQSGLSTDEPQRVDTNKSRGEQLEKSLEISKKADDVDFDASTRSLHKMVRHWLGLRQDCEDLLAQLRFLQETCSRIEGKRGKGWIYDRTVDASESLDVLISQCDICVRWAQVYHDRTQTRINLLFHLANQRTAADTARIAEQTQQDSASMITIAAVTMLFLPGTFICTIVSTNFFDFGEQGLQVSGQWWILLAATIPLTIMVLGVWLGWRRVRARLRKERAKTLATMKIK